MKRSAKNVMIILIAGGISVLTLFVADASAQSTAPTNSFSLTSERFNNQITPLADIVGWRYKSVDGKLYERQYNYSRSTWIGEWRLC